MKKVFNQYFFKQHEGNRLFSQGKIFSIIISLESVDALIGSLLFNILYSYTISTYPSLIFILACFLHFLTLPIFM